MSSSLLTATATELATLLIPVSGRQLILPNVTVAEIIPFTEPDLEDDVPTWFLGYFIWRSQKIPLISFEAINDEPFLSQSSQRRIAVLNGLAGDQLPFCGIVAEGAPRLMRVMPDEIVNDESQVVGPAELARIMVSGEPAAIPDVEYIQQQMINLL